MKITKRFRFSDYEKYKDTKKKFSKYFKDMVGLCLDQDPAKRPSADKLLRHPFFKSCKGADFLVKNVLQGLPSVEQRFRKAIDQEDQEEEEQGSFSGDNVKQRRISGWNFNLEGFQLDPVFPSERGHEDNNLVKQVRFGGETFILPEKPNSPEKGSYETTQVDEGETDTCGGGEAETGGRGAETGGDGEGETGGEVGETGDGGSGGGNEGDSGGGGGDHEGEAGGNERESGDNGGDEGVSVDGDEETGDGGGDVDMADGDEVKRVNCGSDVGEMWDSEAETSNGEADPSVSRGRGVDACGSGGAVSHGGQEEVPGSSSGGVASGSGGGGGGGGGGDRDGEAGGSSGAEASGSGGGGGGGMVNREELLNHLYNLKHSLDGQREQVVAMILAVVGEGGGGNGEAQISREERMTVYIDSLRSLLGRERERTQELEMELEYLKLQLVHDPFNPPFDDDDE